jgi:ubiquinol-cytochrome c reductase cytochrome c subunit
MHWKFVVLAVCLMGLSAGIAAQDAPQGDAERGRKAYMHHLCYTCHGTVGQGGERGAGPPLAPTVWPYSAFAQQTRKPRLVMIPYSEKTLPEQELADMHAYLRTIKTPPAAKDVPLLRDF